MAERRTFSRAGGFSMVEMLVALVFTMVLMAGMATVFKASLSTFYAAGETLSSGRRNRMSIDLLGADLDNACMYLADLVDPPILSANNPAFYILPNQPITGLPASPSATDPTVADQLLFYADAALPFEGSLLGGAQRSDTQLVQANAAATGADTTFTVECWNQAYAQQIVAGQEFLFKDSGEVGLVATPPVLGNGQSANSQVTFTVGASASAGITGSGPTGLVKFSHVPGSGITFIQPAQMIRYSVQFLKLDTQGGDGNLIPCLVRDQGNYATGGFAASQPQQIITENVQAFKVYLSVRPDLISAGSALAWAGDPTGVRSGAWTGFSGWSSGLLGSLNPDQASLTTQLAAADPGATPPASNPNWFRSIPTLVRIDVTTRTATARGEYSPTGQTLARKTLTQSLIFVPRHSGLPMTW